MDDIPLRKDGLQIDEDRSFQERFWSTERLAWVIFVLIVAAALTGATGGGGPLANGKRQIGAARIDYPVIARWTTPDTLSIQFAEAGTAVVLLGPAFLKAFEIESIQPEPTMSTTTPEGLRLEFNVIGEGAAPIFLGIKALVAGSVRYEIGTGGTSPVTFRTFIMP